MDKLETAFLQELTAALAKAKLLGCATTRLEQQFTKYGPASVMKQLANKGQVSDIFDDLAAKKHLELSPEAIAIQGKYGALFNDEQADHFLIACVGNVVCVAYRDIHNSWSISANFISDYLCFPPWFGSALLSQTLRCSLQML